MRIGMTWLLVAAAIGCGSAARADYEGRRVGNWLTSANEDRFGDGGAFVAATPDGSTALAVRCLQKKLSIGLIDMGSDPKPFSEADLFALKFRVDKQPVVETAGVAISARLIEVVTEKSLVKALRDGRETAVRIFQKSGVTSSFVFKTAGAPKAFADLAKECPLD